MTINSCEPESYFSKSNIKKECTLPDFSKLGIVYLYLPNRQDDTFRKDKLKNVIFKTNHYYSLLMLSSLFKPTKDNPILFYYAWIELNEKKTSICIFMIELR